MSDADQRATYKILIVDDEQIVREGIENTIEWSTLGFEFAGSFENGADAAAAVERIEPAVVITDICMPFGDGLELTGFIASKSPRTKVILLTGFDEFEYAQKAVKLGAYDYVLKPITADELRDLLRRVRSDLERDARQAAELRVVSRELAATRGSRIRELTDRLLDGKAAGTPAAGDELTNELRSAGLLRDGPVAAVVADLGGRGSQAEEKVRRLSCSTFEDHEGRTVAVVSGSSEAATDSTARLAADLLTSAGSKHGVATAGIGGTYPTAAGFDASYREAVCSFEYRFILGTGRTIAHSEVPETACLSYEERHPVGGEWSPPFLGAVSALAESLRACDRLETDASLQALFDEMRTGYVSRSRFDLQLHAVLVRINEIQEKRAIAPVGIESFASLADIGQVQRLLLEICISTIEAVEQSRETYAGRKAEEALAFIARHYDSSELSLKAVCAEIGVSPSYFSSIFKGHTGHTFVEYLTSVRMEQAKLLLKKTDLKSYEIAERVGYTDPHYFSTIFKKSTNRSPIEFRREATADGTRIHA